MILSDFEILNLIFFIRRSVAYIMLLFNFVTSDLMLYPSVDDSSANRALRGALGE